MELIDLIFILAILGGSVGVVAGLLGVGGGGVFVPVLTTLFISLNVSNENVVHLALGTSMTTIVATSLSSMLAHKRNQNVEWDAVKVMVPTIVVAAFLTTFVLDFINTLSLTLFFTAFMAFVSFKMFKGAKQEEVETPIKPVQLAPSAGIGIISTLVAIGGGSLSVPYLVSRGRGIKKAIGTSAAIGFPLAVAGSLGYLLNGNIVMPKGEDATLYWGVVGYVHLPAVAILAVFGFITAPIGANLAQKLPVKVLKRIFAILLMLLSLKMLLSVI